MGQEPVVHPAAIGIDDLTDVPGVLRQSPIDEDEGAISGVVDGIDGFVDINVRYLHEN